MGQLPGIDGLSALVERIEEGEEPSAVASAMELVLEGLHLNRRLNRDSVDDKYVYRA